MKKINVKVTVFLSVIVLAVIILLLNFIEFRKTLDFTASGIRMLKENASGKQGRGTGRCQWNVFLSRIATGFMQVLLTGRYPLQERERSHRIISFCTGEEKAFSKVGEVPDRS
ncbi:MAG: hypothetical protein ACLVGL_08655 [Waltera sp.]